MFKFSLVVLLLTAGQASISAQQWTSNFLNLFSDNFRNLLQQMPTAPLSTTSIQNIIHHQPSSNYNPSPLISPYAYGSRSKDELLQYSDEDPASLNGLQPNYPSSSHHQNLQPNAYPSSSHQNALQPNAYPSNAYSPASYNAYAYSNAFHNNYQLPSAPKSPHAQFDDDPLYDVLSKTDYSKKNLNSINLNKNVNWDDHPSLPHPSAYNLDNIYNNRFDYNRLPAIPDHVSFVPPPESNQQVSNNLYSPATSSQANVAQSPPVVAKSVTDLQQLPGNNLQMNSGLDASVSQPHSAFSSFLAANKLNLANFNTLPTAVASQQVASPHIASQPSQVISANSVEQQYEQAKPKFTSLTSDVYQSKAIVTNSLPSNQLNNLQALPAAPTTSGLKPTAHNLPIAHNIATDHNLPTVQNLPTVHNLASTAAFPDDALHKLYQLYKTFASAAFSTNLHPSASVNNAVNNAVKNPSVIYYDNIIHHTPQQPVSSSQADQSAINHQLNSIERPLSGDQLSDDSKTGQLVAQNSFNSVTNPEFQSTNAVAPNLDAKVEVTTQPQTPLSSLYKVRRKKLLKVKRKHQRANQRTNQRSDFGTRRRKDELEAIEK